MAEALGIGPSGINWRVSAISTCSMDRPMPSLFNLDNLCRDIEDGAYHCPSCNVPFTRRSNLRRHFVIHTRNMPFKCNLCESRFSRSDELHYHSLSCAEIPWQGATTLNLPIFPTFSSNPSFDATALLQTDITDPSQAQDPLPTIQTSSVGQDTEQAFEDFISCISSPTVDVIEGFRMSYDHSGVWSNMLDSTNDNSSPASVSPIVHNSSTIRAGRYPRRTLQPYSTLNRRKKLKDKPIYTRRQVDDMLNAVSSCFAGAMEEVLKRLDAASVTKGDRMPDLVVPVESPNHGLRELLSETLPRLFNGLQTIIDERKAY